MGLVRHALHSAVCTGVCLLAAACAVQRAAPATAAGTGAMNHDETWPSAVRPLLLTLREDAARRSGVAADQLRTVSVQAVTWPSGALGCPQPGMLYTDVMVPGWRVSIEGPSGAALTYHASRQGAWVWCPRERATPPATTPPDAAI